MAKGRSRKKKRINYRILVVLAGILCFAAALVIYFTNSYKDTERENAVYSSMEEATLPEITAEVNERLINRMCGYLQDMGNKAASDSITPLPENRRLRLHIKLYDYGLASLTYEVRSLDLSHFIEKTEVSEFGVHGNELTADLPIQNMIEKNTPYFLKIELDLGEKRVNYYTRIIWPETDSIFRMIDTAAGFNSRTYDYSEARELTVFMEAEPNADNSNLAEVGIHSNFSQLTWAGSGMQADSEADITVKEFDGIMGAVEIRYETRTGNETGNPDRYSVTDEFVMRTGAERVYLMNYQRKTNQIFEGNKHLFAGKRINLGIINKEALQTRKSEDGRFIVFKSDKELWMYDQSGKRAVNLFSFRSENDRLRAGSRQHDVRIISVDNDGSVDFVVYGYMLRGRNEGNNGLAYYTYNAVRNSITEHFFIPIQSTFEEIKKEVDELCVKSVNGMFYLKQNDSVAAIDLTSLEMMDVVSNLKNGTYAVSRDQSIIAWLDSSSSKSMIKLMDIETGSTQTIQGQEGEVLSVITFYNNDLIYGVSHDNDIWTLNGRYKGMPMHTLRIISKDLTPVREYSKPRTYISGLTIENDRLHVELCRKGSRQGEYRFASKDTLVCSEAETDTMTAHISTAANEGKKLVCYVDLDETIKTTRGLNVAVPDNISYENTGSLELLGSRAVSGKILYAYANGHLAGKVYDLSSALDLCYDDMGWVTDENSVVVYSRADKLGSKNIQDFKAAASPLLLELDSLSDRVKVSGGYIILDAQGIELNRILYYVGKGFPIAANIGDEVYLICAYDSNSVTVYIPSEEEGSGSKTVLTMEEAALLFSEGQNDFVVFKSYCGR